MIGRTSLDLLVNADTPKVGTEVKNESSGLCHTTGESSRAKYQEESDAVISSKDEPNIMTPIDSDPMSDLESAKGS